MVSNTRLHPCLSRYCRPSQGSHTAVNEFPKFNAYILNCPPNRKLIPNFAVLFMALGLVVLGYANVYDVTHCHQLQALSISHLSF